MKCVVYYVDWEYDCCGKPFKIGDKIEWNACLPCDGFEEYHGKKCDYVLFFHMEDDKRCFEISGTITKIENEFCKYKIKNRDRIPIEYKFIEVQNSTDILKINNKISDDFSWLGFWVTLDIDSITEYNAW